MSSSAGRQGRQVEEHGQQRQQQPPDEQGEQGVGQQLAAEDAASRHGRQQQGVKAAMFPLQRHAAVVAQDAGEDERDPQHAADGTLAAHALQLEGEAEDQDGQQRKQAHQPQQLVAAQLGAQVLAGDAQRCAQEAAAHQKDSVNSGVACSQRA